MHSLRLALASLLSLTSAFPTTLNPNTTSLLPRTNAETFKINVVNQCPFSKSFAIYQITSSFTLLQTSKTASLPENGTHTFTTPFTSTGMRLAGHAEWPLGSQWQPQALFEFGYAVVEGQKGTAYDLSVMQGSDKDIGIGVYPIANGKGSGKCESKTCFPWDCPASQGWTSPGQVSDGSPADTGCYEGKTDFKVVFCP